MKKSLFIFILITTLIFSLTACTTENGSERKAVKLLKTANENFKTLNSYMEVTYKWNPVGEEYEETKVYFKDIHFDKNNEIEISDSNVFIAAFPKKVHNSSELQKENPTLIIQTEKEEDKIYQNEFVREENKEDFIPFKSYEKTIDIIKLKKEDILNYLKMEEETLKIENDLVYRNSIFALSTFPDKIQNLKIEKEIEENGKNYIVLKGVVIAEKVENKPPFKKAEVEIWFDKDKELVVRETYNANKFTEETEQKGFITYEYSFFNKEINEPEFKLLDFSPEKLQEKYNFYQKFFGQY